MSVMHPMNRLFVALALLPTLATTAPQPGATASGAVLGRLGQALKASSIYSSQSTRARVFYRVKQYEYLIVRPSRSSSWIAVVMENGRLGYIPSSRVATLPYNVTSDRVAPQQAKGSSTKAAIAQYGLRYTGTRYVWGGNSLTGGIDCSGFVQQLFGKIGIDLPRTAAEQARVGKPIERLEDLKPGDRLYFWDRRRGKIGHTGLYLGNGYFVHSSSNNRGVDTDDLRNPRWRNILVSARR